MSAPYLGFGKLRMWSAQELAFRDGARDIIVDTVMEALRALNPAWTAYRCEAPMLVPRSALSAEYSDHDIWMLRNREFALRAETTPGTYEYARMLMANSRARVRPPVCVWQMGKSFRVEANDGATGSKLRFWEFTQLEMQCIYSQNTKADYREIVEAALLPRLIWLCSGTHERPEGRIIESDRLPSYSEKTNDVEIKRGSRTWTEVCSISTRTDFAEDMRVLEVAVGMDRVVEIHGENSRA